MSLPLVTRFGADPLLDLEVANKQYVDSSGGGAAKDIWTMCYLGTQSSNTVLYWPIGNDTSADGVESDIQAVLSYEVTQRRMICRVYTNTKAGAVILSLRDDGTNINPVTIAAGTTGIFDSGDVTTVIALNSLLSFTRDASAGVSGVIGFNCVAQMELDT